MELDVLLFAGLKETVGRDRLRVTLAPGARVSDLLERLAASHAVLRPHVGSFAVAVNLSVATRDQVLAPGDEVALLPPVGGGAPDGDRIELIREPIDASSLLRFVTDPGAGGVTLFLGTARDVHEGRAVARLEYDAYASMAEKVLHALARETRERFPDLKRIAITHRLGNVPITETAVAVAVSAPHRDESFKACRFAIDALKARAPIWKKELFKDGEAHWVENCEGCSDAAS